MHGISNQVGSIVLRPLSCLYRAGFLLNRYLYSSGFKKVYTAPVPVMVIGNITVGEVEKLHY